MQFAAALLEYLVTGCGALLWITLALNLNSLPGDGAAAGWLLPILYVIGMFIDAFMSLAFRRLKHYARGDAQSERGFDLGGRTKPERSTLPFMSRVLSRLKQLLRGEGSSTEPPLFGPKDYIALHSKELDRGVQIRSTRDRIARGAVFNVFLIGVVSLVVPGRLKSFCAFHEVPPRGVIALVTLAMTVFALCVWWHYEYYTDQFKVGALEAIERQKRGAPIRSVPIAGDSVSAPQR